MTKKAKKKPKRENLTLSDEEMHERMENGWRGGLPDGTVCGQGSTMANTNSIRQWLPRVVTERGIKKVCDAGAGDLHWVESVAWDVKYSAFDLIPRHPSVEALDITREKLPKCDLILCRMVLNHLDDQRIEMALKLFKKSGKYLAATHFVGGGVQRTRQFMRCDLTKWLGQPIEMCPDGHEANCRLAIWEL